MINALNFPEHPEAAQAAKSRVLAAHAASETLKYHFDFIRLSQHTVWHLKAQIQLSLLLLSAL
jgi:hypothetical protein